MSLFEAVRLAIAQIRVQKLKSFFTLLGVTIGVMFLIAVVSIVEGMSKYVEEDFIGRLLGANTFTLRRFPWFGNNTTYEEWREWQRRPRFYQRDVRAITAVLPDGTRWAVESQENVWATTPYARPRQVEGHAVEGDYFTIKKYDLSSGRAFTPQEVELQLPRLTLTYDRRLNDDLQALGMRAAFAGDGADFTRMSSLGNRLYLTRVQQKTFVKIDEEGTEASAVTATGVGVTSMPQTITMVVDRPYLFVIRERLSGTILFMGKITRVPLG